MSCLVWLFISLVFSKSFGYLIVIRTFLVTAVPNKNRANRNYNPSNDPPNESTSFFYLRYVFFECVYNSLIIRPI